MSGETNRLLALAKQVNDDPPAEYERELDVIAATGEQVSVGLVSLAIQKAGGRVAIAGDPKSHATRDLIRIIVERFGAKPGSGT